MRINSNAEILCQRIQDMINKPGVEISCYYSDKRNYHFFYLDTRDTIGKSAECHMRIDIMTPESIETTATNLAQLFLKQIK